MLRLLKKRVLLRRPQAVEKTKSGLYLPESARDLSQLAEVVATAFDSDLSVGSRALLPKHLSDVRRIELKGVEYELVEESELLAVVESEPKARSRRKA